MTLPTPIFFARRFFSVLACAALGALAGGCATSGGMANPEAPAPPPRPTAQNPKSAPQPLPGKSGRLALGIDVLAGRNFDVLQGKRVGLLTHLAGVNRDGVSTIEVLRHAPGVKLVALYAPEHGLYGDITAGAVVPKVFKDKQTGLPVYAFFQTPEGDFRRPTPDMLKDIDVMVVDLQDLGTRSYTYISCLLCTMESCFEQGKTVVVLDRPNPLGGLKVGGPPMDDKWMSYIGAYHIPYVYGLTIGELARLAKDNPGLLPNPERVPAVVAKLFKVSPDVWRRGHLEVIAMQNWRRSMTWQETGLPWAPTSPNIPDFAAALGYGLTGLGRPVDDIGKFSHSSGAYHFRLLSYPGRKPADLALALNRIGLGGLHFDVKNFKNSKGADASGVYVTITDWNAVEPTKLAFEMMKLDAGWATGGNPYAKLTEAQARTFNINVGWPSWLDELRTKGGRANVDGFFQIWEAQAAAFQQMSRRWWLYSE